MSLFFFMFTYNYSLFTIFWVFQLFIITKFKTIYSFSELKYSFFFVISITVCLLSMAGVPPFLGFFTKVLILITLLNSNFFFLYLLFFVLLFFALYFYAQNIRFLFSTAPGKINYSFSVNLRLPSIFFLHSYFTLLALVSGFFYLEDFFIFFLWIII